MDRIKGTGHVNNRFVAEDVATNRPATEITAEIMNALQEEVCTVIERVGDGLDGSKEDQLFKAIEKMVAMPPGTRLLFPQATAPTGWTQIVTDAADNRMLRVVKTAGAGTGGLHSPIINSVVAAHTHGFTTGGQSANHTHSGWTASQSALHTHAVITFAANDFNGGGAVTGTDDTHGGPWEVNGTGTEGGEHQHFFQTGGFSADHNHSGSTDNGSSQTNWTPRYLDLILCQKD